MRKQIDSIKRCLLRNTCILLAALSPAVSVSAEGYVSIDRPKAEISIFPSNPVSSEDIIVVAHGMSSDCGLEDPQFTRSGSEFRIDFAPRPADLACAATVGPWAEIIYPRTYPRAGTYTVILTRGGVEFARQSFTVRNLVIMAPERIICRNLRTGKKVVIRNPTGLERTHEDIGDCAEQGLKLRSGDKVERTYRGVVTGLFKGFDE